MSTFFVVPFTLAGCERASGVESTVFAPRAPESWWQRSSGKSYRTPDNKCIVFGFIVKTGASEQIVSTSTCANSALRSTPT